MMTALRDDLRQQTLGMRETYRDLYRHYRIERDRAEHRLVQRSHGDEAILASLARLHEEQHRQNIERQVRRFAEASRFVTREPKDKDAA